MTVTRIIIECIPSPCTDQSLLAANTHKLSAIKPLARLCGVTTMISAVAHAHSHASYDAAMHTSSIIPISQSILF